jgi:hypothetical protein
MNKLVFVQINYEYIFMKVWKVLFFSKEMSTDLFIKELGNLFFGIFEVIKNSICCAN